VTSQSEERHTEHRDKIVQRVNGFRLHQTAMYLESQTQFGDIPRPRKGSPDTFLDPTQPRERFVMPTKTEYVEGTPNWVDVQTTDQ
jgi:hypothetical protein